MAAQDECWTGWMVGWDGTGRVMMYVAPGRELERAFLSRSGSSLVTDGLGPEVSVAAMRAGNDGRG